mmetsp:Transcript_18161/g.45766  ORF Transcript_18161/g.45766 Transcript_18161/m.45766 type:complete len:212 (-) Transcript_18161:521-1156(-)
MSSSFSPLPRRYPSCLLRERGPKQVPKVSPTPESPIRVDRLPPTAFATIVISRHPRVTSADIAFVPRPSPSHMPAAMAMTFLTAPPISTPMTSLDVKTLKFEFAKSSTVSSHRRSEAEATVTAVARPAAISLAKEGPLRNASSRMVPVSSTRMSFMRERVPDSMPFETQMMDVVGGMCSATFLRNSRLYCVGTACRMYVASRNASDPSAVA